MTSGSGIAAQEPLPHPSRGGRLGRRKPFSNRPITVASAVVIAASTIRDTGDISSAPRRSAPPNAIPEH